MNSGIRKYNLIRFNDFKANCKSRLIEKEEISIYAWPNVCVCVD